MPRPRPGVYARQKHRIRRLALAMWHRYRLAASGPEQYVLNAGQDRPMHYAGRCPEDCRTRGAQVFVWVLGGPDRIATRWVHSHLLLRQGPQKPYRDLTDEL